MTFYLYGVRARQVQMNNLVIQSYCVTVVLVLCVMKWAGPKYRSQVTGQVTGHRIQVTGYRSQVTGYKQKYKNIKNKNNSKKKNKRNKENLNI